VSDDVADMVVLKRFLGLAFVVLAIIAAARAARPGARLIARSFRTSSSPGAGAYDIAASLFLAGYYDDIAADCGAVLAGDAADAEASAGTGVAGETGGAAVPTGPPAILENGPWPGHVGQRLLALLPDARWTGLDIDPAMLEAARGRLARANLSDRAALVQGDVAALPFEDAAFDLVVSSLSAHHWPDAEAGFREIGRVLRPGGVALVYDPPAGWGHVETGSSGIDGAGAAFDDPIVTRFRGFGPFTIVSRVELRRPVGGERGDEVPRP
jgi:SAM-dependent methyltransferase